LVVAAIQLLRVPGSRSAEIYVSLILTLLVILAVISYHIHRPTHHPADRPAGAGSQCDRER
jgi:hypothetical protein